MKRWDDDDEEPPPEEEPRYLLPGGAKNIGDVLLPKSISVPDPVSAGELAIALNLKPHFLIAGLMEFNIFASINTLIDFEIVATFCSRHGVVAHKIA